MCRLFAIVVFIISTIGISSANAELTPQQVCMKKSFDAKRKLHIDNPSPKILSARRKLMRAMGTYCRVGKIDIANEIYTNVVPSIKPISKDEIKSLRRIPGSIFVCQDVVKQIMGAYRYLKTNRKLRRGWRLQAQSMRALCREKEYKAVIEIRDRMALSIKKTVNDKKNLPKGLPNDIPELSILTPPNNQKTCIDLAKNAMKFNKNKRGRTKKRKKQIRRSILPKLKKLCKVEQFVAVANITSAIDRATPKEHKGRRRARREMKLQRKCRKRANRIGKKVFRGNPPETIVQARNYQAQAIHVLCREGQFYLANRSFKTLRKQIRNANPTKNDITGISMRGVRQCEKQIRKSLKPFISELENKNNQVFRSLAISASNLCRDGQLKAARIVKQKIRTAKKWDRENLPKAPKNKKSCEKLVLKIKSKFTTDTPTPRVLAARNEHAKAISALCQEERFVAAKSVHASLVKSIKRTIHIPADNNDE